MELSFRKLREGAETVAVELGTVAAGQSTESANRVKVLKPMERGSEEVRSSDLQGQEPPKSYSKFSMMIVIVWVKHMCLRSLQESWKWTMAPENKLPLHTGGLSTSVFGRRTILFGGGLTAKESTPSTGH